jgi:hypothetical protein
VFLTYVAGMAFGQKNTKSQAAAEVGGANGQGIIRKMQSIEISVLSSGASCTQQICRFVLRSLFGVFPIKM